MKLAIMQPYFFPYAGYFSLIKNTDFFVFFDTPQYIRKGWINRNRIIGADGKDLYITVPVEKQHRQTPINQIKIKNDSNWKEKILGQLTVYKRKAPFYKEVCEIMKEILERDYDNISEIAIQSILCTCEYVGIDIKYDIYSQMNIPKFDVKSPDEWALYITKHMGYDTYINPPGGKSFFDAEKYKKENISLQFLHQELVEYNQRNNIFVPGLSMVDIMMFCKPDEILKMLDAYTLEGEESLKQRGSS